MPTFEFLNGSQLKINDIILLLKIRVMCPPLESESRSLCKHGHSWKHHIGVLLTLPHQIFAGQRRFRSRTVKHQTRESDHFRQKRRVRSLCTDAHGVVSSLNINKEHMACMYSGCAGPPTNNRYPTPGRVSEPCNRRPFRAVRGALESAAGARLRLVPSLKTRERYRDLA
ncbi:hypothetical protein L484_026267 [Morus notabilis]|uniref:Uncharacterized protein n=1 Tax=Morus notabilis TaxID=981085 RepID=W9RH00_9ROSA|nr:hypothetical protein L484_026267 [Morus notabilis]